MIVLKSYLIKVIVANASHQANAVFPTHIHILAARGGRCIGAIWATHYKLGERGLFYFFYSITAKVVFSVLDLLSVMVQSESSDSSRVSNGPASFWANSSTWKIAQAFSVDSNVKTYKYNLTFTEIEAVSQFQVREYVVRVLGIEKLPQFP